jgi:hypothetical protein
LVGIFARTPVEVSPALAKASFLALIFSTISLNFTAFSALSNLS